MNNSQDKKVIFLLNTEYGLLISLLYFYEYLKKYNYTPIFVFLPSSSNRFKNISFYDLPGIFKNYKNELNNKNLFPNNDFEKFMETGNVSEIVMNNPIYFTSHIIINKIKKKNLKCKITLLADSVGIDRKCSNKDLLLFSIKLYIRKFINLYSKLPSKVIDYHNAEDFLDLFIAHRNLYNKAFIDSNTLISKISTYKSDICKIYKFNVDFYENFNIIFFTQTILHYANIDSVTKNNYIKTLELISSLAIKYKMNILLKLHPAESLIDYEKYGNNYVKIDTNPNIVAEIIINSISNRKIISVNSSVSCFDVNKQNKHYWLYKALSGFEPIIKDSYSYINSINSMNEIEKIFKNEI